VARLRLQSWALSRQEASSNTTLQQVLHTGLEVTEDGTAKAETNSPMTPSQASGEMEALLPETRKEQNSEALLPERALGKEHLSSVFNVIGAECL
jgi:hypothetical protein